MIQFTYRLWPYAIVFVVIGIVMILSENSSRYSEKQKCLFFIAIIGCTVLAGLFQNRMIAASSIESREFNAQYLEEYNNYVGAGEWLPLGVAEEITDLEAETLVVPDQGDRKDLTTSGKYKIFYNDKEAETRMGSGKGTLEYWVAVVKPGRVMFEISGVSEEVAREALRLATHKLPCKCKVVSRADLEGGDNSEN